MNTSVQIIPLTNLVLAFIPALIVVAVMWKWDMGYKNALYAIFRMLIQLLLIGFFLAQIFEANNAWVVIAVLSIMLFTASWIALRTIQIPRKTLYASCFLSITLGGGSVLLLVTQGVLDLQPWYLTHYVIPLAGMIFASAMNSISLTGERLQAELDRGIPFDRARTVAFNAALIPITNTLFAVGLVSLPGMMTGQILSGVSPFLAARYQIMVMCMMFGAAGMSAALFLMLTKAAFTTRTGDR